MKKIALFLIDFYRKHLSKLKRKPTCRFYPTCSEYAYVAIQKHGFFFGSLLAIKRILKCNPFCKGGVDYVPETLFAKKKRP